MVGSSAILIQWVLGQFVLHWVARLFTSPHGGVDLQKHSSPAICAVPHVAGEMTGRRCVQPGERAAPASGPRTSGARTAARGHYWCQLSLTIL